MSLPAPELTAALQHLSQADPVLARLIAQGRLIQPSAHEDLYLALLRAIVSQQISTKAAAAIWRKVQALFPPDGYPEPAALLLLTDEDLRAAGISRQKAGYLRAIADFAQRDQLDHAHLSQLDADAFTAHLTQIKGVGRWTAQMLQMFALDQPDVFPEGDLGIQNAMKRHYGLEETGRALLKRMTAIAEAWRPYRTVASKYLWQSLDNTPAE
ncbi:DNA-3-methyladenine glycosylase 2 family protein [Hymenobacter taeanensis]|uniref:DNA-3-methyladenine glycosylase II n=1 Tax=Hymenobacter taeanensis TaxID=2735321 RepID=A0A6M6BE40_9BACT|nr:MULTISPECIES: DNA-3-methyladenine glycosylase 2 family protein [Hymenobacter]QJX45455.1 DNA-3-methyladenine glycosylase 2 family protein [Hymenobacter taeanensis]UOQ81299.1 DNA-3-methyladenine glycosylase 2 family protein [Hymenobacter sp. 5414T-23]